MRCLRSLLFASTLGALLGCSPIAHADQVVVAVPGVVAPRIALAVSPAKVRAPYDVQVMTESGETASTFAHRDRFYVQGSAGQRYIIRITNPTPNRVEAVVSVDGLDVVDGESGDLRKRGYVVPPHGETRIEGFRTSQADVATFRFSAVSDSYAGKKGKARNVGVIAVAIFEEQAREQQIIITERPRPTHRSPYDNYDYDDEGEDDLGYAPGADSVSTRGAGGGRGANRAPASPPAKMSIKPKAADESVSRSSRRPSPTGGAVAPQMDRDYYEPEPAPRQRPTERPGLGTEYGEQRYSAASFTQFVRAAGRPIAIAELRYNDAAGLMALGIPVQPLPDAGEIMTRETANPFPGDHRFASPPR